MFVCVFFAIFGITCRFPVQFLLITYILQRKLNFLTILATLLTFAACEEIKNLDVGPEIKIPEASKEIFASGVRFEAAVSGQGLNKTVQFSATDAWSVEVNDTKASSWVTVVPTSGAAGDVTLSVTAQPNNEESERAAIVTITCGPIKTTFTVRQAAKAPIPVAEVKLDKSELSLVTGESAKLTATVSPSDAGDKTLTWTSSDPSVATVTDGTVKAFAAGTTVIAVQAGDKTATCTVTVTDPVVEVSGITLDQTTLALIVGETGTLNATISPDNASVKTVTWTSSDPKVAYVSGGTVTAISAGTATITAQAGDKTATCEVTVSLPPVPVDNITLDQTSLNLVAGDAVVLTATVTPDDAADPTVTWTSSDPSVATVANGTVTAVAPGTATITAKAGEKTATCAVTVNEKAIEVESVTLDPAELNLTTGETATLNGKFSPDNATNPAISWTSSNPAVATVADGTVTAVAAGTATITYQAGEKSATCKVTVKDPVIEVTSLTLSKTETEIEVGQSDYVLARIIPSDATDQTVTWSTSNKAVATVADGVIQAVSVGTATVTAKSANGLTADCKVTVVAPATPPAPPVEVSSVSIDKDTLKLEIAASETLTATVLPNDATDPSVTWTSTDASVASVSSTGSVTAIAAGQTYVIAQAGEQKDTCVVVVAAPSLVPTSISLNKTSLGLTVGGAYDLVATVGPASATDKSVTWESLQPTTVSVDSNGRVTGLAIGTAYITATTVNGLTATCTVTVLSSSVDPGSPDPFNAEENW